MTNWLANATGIHISPKKAYVDRRQLGGALKTISPLAGAFIPGVGGLLTGGLGSMLGEGVRPGGNFGSIVGSGVKGAGLAQLGHTIGGEQGLKTKLRNMFTGGGGAPAAEAAGGAAGQAAGNVAGDLPFGEEGLYGGGSGVGSGPAFAPAFTPSSAIAATAGQGAAQAAGGGAVGKLATYKDYAPVAAAALNYAGGSGGRAADARLASAQAQQVEDENAQRKAQQAMLDPLRKLLQDEWEKKRASGYVPFQVATNPYAANAGAGGGAASRSGYQRSGYFVPAG